MRVLVTSDLHFDHGRSGKLAAAVAAEISDLGERGAFDAILVVGDTATSRGDALERGLAQLRFNGPRLATLGNHELWSDGDDTWTLFDRTLPDRIEAAGWHCLDRAPAVVGGVGFVGSVGWYDYAFAPAYLGVPRRFYEARIAPGSAAYYTAYRHLLDPGEDIPPAAHDIIARWNDGRYIRWDFTDAQFTELLLERLSEHLAQLAACPTVVAAIHHLPAAELLPPPATAAWDFAKAYLGSPRFGQLLATHGRVRHVFTGHSHFAASAEIGRARYLATGSGYRAKKYHIVEV